jgi:hypothetical protein
MRHGCLRPGAGLPEEGRPTSPIQRRLSYPNGHAHGMAPDRIRQSAAYSLKLTKMVDLRFPPPGITALSRTQDRGLIAWKPRPHITRASQGKTYP